MSAPYKQGKIIFFLIGYRSRFGRLEKKLVAVNGMVLVLNTVRIPVPDFQSTSIQMLLVAIVSIWAYFFRVAFWYLQFKHGQTRKNFEEYQDDRIKMTENHLVRWPKMVDDCKRFFFTLKIHHHGLPQFLAWVGATLSTYTLRIRLNTLMYVITVFIRKYAHTCNLAWATTHAHSLTTQEVSVIHNSSAALVLPRSMFWSATAGWLSNFGSVTIPNERVTLSGTRVVHRFQLNFQSNND